MNSKETEHVGLAKMECYASCLGDCHGGISREHYISEAVLKLGGNKVRVSGFPWQQQDESMEIGIGALTSKILCNHHNSELSPLDDAGQSLLRALKAGFDEASQEGQFAPEVFTIDGNKVELWLLKMLCGIIVLSDSAQVPDKWIRILFGRAPFPEASGLHLFGTTGSALWFFNLVRVISVQDQNGRIAGAKFGLGGLALVLAFGKLGFEEGGMQSLYRPLAIDIEKGAAIKRLAFAWSSGTGRGSLHLKIEGQLNGENVAIRPIVMPDTK